MAADLSSTTRKNEALATYDSRKQATQTPAAPPAATGYAKTAPTTMPSGATASNDSSWRYSDSQRAAEAERARRRAQQDAQDQLDEMQRRVRRAERDAAYARQTARETQNQPPVVVYRNTPGYGTAGVATGAAIGAGAVMANEQPAQSTESRVSSSTLDAMAGIEAPKETVVNDDADRGLSLGMIMLIVALLALIGGALYWFVFRKKDDKKGGRYAL